MIRQYMVLFNNKKNTVLTFWLLSKIKHCSLAVTAEIKVQVKCLLSPHEDEKAWQHIIAWSLARWSRTTLSLVMHPGDKSFSFSLLLFHSSLSSYCMCFQLANSSLQSTAGLRRESYPNIKLKYLDAMFFRALNLFQQQKPHGCSLKK